MKALILAGGLATRLRPLTLTRPKHLLPVANRSHIEHVFDLLVRHGVSEVVLLTSHLAEAFEAVRSRAELRGLKLEVAHEPSPLGTAGALKHAEHLAGDDTFVVFNGDILTDLDLSAAIDFHRARRAVATIALTRVDDPSAYGVVPTDQHGRVLGFIEKPPPDEARTDMVNAGIYVFEPSVLARIPQGEVWSLERQLFPELVRERAALYAVGSSAYWMDIGTPEAYLQANLDALAGRFAGVAVARPGPDGVLLANGARLPPDARVSWACLGEGCLVEPRARVQRAVLLPAAVVSADAEVRDSILGEGARVEAGAKVIDRAIGDREVVAASGGQP